MNKNAKNSISRRNLVKVMGGAVTATAVFNLMGCNSSSPNGGTTISDITDEDLNNIGPDQTTVDIDANAWAAGGTNALKTAFPPTDPFKESLGVVCPATPRYTLGPCYFNPDEFRQDISDGEKGIPMIVCLKVVDSACQPLENIDVDIWHCNTEGQYSASSSGSSDAASFRAGFCSGNDPVALESRWFRGVQKTNSEGFVYFKSCFPGWYPGRTAHIHVKIVRNGVQSLITQLGYNDALSRNIYLNHQDYTGVEQDTTNASDNVFRSNSAASYSFYISKNDDNSMTAYKTIQLI